MYEYKYSMVKENTLLDPFVKVDLSTMPATQMLSKYPKVLHHILENGEERVIDMDLMIHYYADRYTDITIPQTFAVVTEGFDDYYIPTPSYEGRYALYADAWVAEYKIEAVNSVSGVTSLRDLNDDLVLSKDKVSADDIVKYGLVSVNGFLHFTYKAVDPVNGGYCARVHGGGRTGYLTNDNNVGMISFAGVGEIEQVLIKEDMIYSPGENHWEQLHINLGKDISNYTPLLSLGGWLVTPGNAFNVVGNTSVAVNLGRCGLIERYLEMLGKVDLSLVQQHMTPKDDSWGSPPNESFYNQISVDEFNTSGFCKAWMLLPQTFVILVKRNDLHIIRQPLEKLNIPGRHLTQERPQYPILGGYNQIVDYTTFQDDGVWVVRGRPTPIHRYTYDSTSLIPGSSVDATRTTVKPFTNSQAWFFKIGYYV